MTDQDTQAANFEDCFRAAKKAGKNETEAEHCDSGALRCPDCPWQARVALKLTGQNGNAFAILSAAKDAMRKAGWSQVVQDEIMTEAMSGDYDHLLRTMLKHFEVE